MNRREFLAAAGALPLFGLSGRAVARTMLGTAVLDTVSDGHLVLPAAFLFEPMPQAELAELRARLGLTGDELRPECNLALYRDGTNTVLFDAGSGPDFMPSAGELLASLDAAGVTPEEITHVVFTHGHPDHLWGLIDDFDELVFPQASYLMGRTEWDYWWNPATVETIGAARIPFAVGARRRMAFIEERVQLFDDGEEILPGIAAFATHGHTPGHMSFEIRSGGAAAMIVGDAIANDHVAFARPDWPSGTDQDLETAARTRSRLIERLAAEGLTMVGFHLPQGGVGRVERAAEGYRFVPAGG